MSIHPFVIGTLGVVINVFSFAVFLYTSFCKVICLMSMENQRNIFYCYFLLFGSLVHGYFYYQDN